jgi:hypothetical protein
MKDYQSGGLMRTNPEQYSEMFTQTRSGKIIMKVIKTSAIIACELLCEDEDNKDLDMIGSIMRSEVVMTGEVYRDYFNTKVFRDNENWCFHEWVEDGVKRHKLYAVPHKVDGYDGDAMPIVDFIYTQLHEWITDQVRLFTARVMLEMM